MAVMLSAALVVAPDPRPAAGQTFDGIPPLPDPPVLEVDPPCGPLADDVGRDITLTFRGYNMVPGDSLDIYFDAGSELSQSAPVTVGPYGYFETQLTFNQSSSSFFEIRAYETSGFDDVSTLIASTQFTAPCGPRTTATPSCDAAADPLGPPRKLDIRVQGTGWTARLGVQVYLRAPDGSIVSQAPDQTVDLRRSFGVTLSAPALAAGEYQIVAVQDNDNLDIISFPVPCPEPEIQVEPPPCTDVTGAPPATWYMVITGSGFRPNAFDRTTRNVQFTFDADGSPQIFFTDQPIQDAGPFRVAIDPYQRPEGQYAIIARQLDFRGHIIREATTVFSVPCRPPAVAIDPPACGPPQLVGDEPRRYSLVVRGFNFAPGQVTITFDADGLTGLSPDLFFTDVGADGSFVRPIDPLARPTGTYRIDVVQDGRLGPITLSLFFSVPCEPASTELTADPACDRQALGEEQAYAIDLTGGGFYEGPVELIFDADGSPETDVTLAREDGTFDHTFTANGRALGTFMIVARQSDQVGVVAESSVLFVVSCDSAILRIIPGSGSPGFVARVEGENFPAGTTVALRWNRGIQADQGIEVQVDGAGAFQRQVLIFHHDFLGGREMTAGTPVDPNAFPGVSATFLVVPGRGSPPVFIGGPFAGNDAPIVIRR